MNVNNYVKWVSARPSVWPSYLFEPNLEKKETAEVIKYVISKINYHTSPTQWFLGPKYQKTPFLKQLKNNGFRKSVSWAGMGLDLSKVKQEFSGPENFKIFQASTKNTLDKWQKVVSHAMFGGGYLGIDLFENLLGSEKVYFFLGTIEGKPVSSSLLFLSSGVAGLFMISTLPHYRNKGIGTITTLTPLLEAKRKGIKYGGLFATYLGKSVYRRIGFKKICSFDVYTY